MAKGMGEASGFAHASALRLRGANTRHWRPTRKATVGLGHTASRPRPLGGAAVAILITMSNLPWLLRSNDMKLLAANMAGGAAFMLVGLVIYRTGTAVERRYRTHIVNRIR